MRINRKGVKEMVARFLGVNLEPVPDGVKYPEGRQLNEANLKKTRAKGFDYIVIAGNPKTVSPSGLYWKELKWLHESWAIQLNCDYCRKNARGGRRKYSHDIPETYGAVHSRSGQAAHLPQDGLLHEKIDFWLKKTGIATRLFFNREHRMEQWLRWLFSIVCDLADFVKMMLYGG